MEHGAIQEAAKALMQTMAKMDVFVIFAPWVKVLRIAHATRIHHRRGHANQQRGARLDGCLSRGAFGEGPFRDRYTGQCRGKRVEADRFADDVPPKRRHHWFLLLLEP